MDISKTPAMKQAFREKGKLYRNYIEDLLNPSTAAPYMLQQEYVSEVGGGMRSRECQGLR